MALMVNGLFVFDSLLLDQSPLWFNANSVGPSSGDPISHIFKYLIIVYTPKMGGHFIS